MLRHSIFVTAVMIVLTSHYSLAAPARPAVPAAQEDTFDRLLKKQVEAQESAYDAQIANNRKTATQNTEAPSVGVNPHYRHGEPVVQAIWGLKGREVAEINYKGQTIPVSRQAPYISQIDGWRLKGINAYQVILIRVNKRGKVLHRKIIPFDWSGGQSGYLMTHAADSSQIVPPIATTANSPLVQK